MSGRAHNDWPRAVAKRISIRGDLNFTPTRVGQTLHLPCERGNHVVDFTITGNMPPDFVAKKMLAKGWTIGSKLVCPDCSKPPRKVVANDEGASMATTGTEVAQTTIKPVSDAARTKRREALQWLDESFDPEKGCFREGQSDATIAKETGLAETAVAALREEFYGPLKCPPEIADFNKRFADLRAEVTAAVDAMRQAIRKEELRLEAFLKKNGWAE
jgi:hypothetical protein